MSEQVNSFELVFTQTFLARFLYASFLLSLMTYTFLTSIQMNYIYNLTTLPLHKTTMSLGI